MKSVCLFKKSESVTADSGKEMLAMPIIIDSSSNKRFFRSSKGIHVLKLWLDQKQRCTRKLYEALKVDSK